MKVFKVPLLAALLALLAVGGLAQTNNPPLELGQGGGVIRAEASGGFFIRPKAGQGIRLVSSCAGATVAAAGEAKYCYDAASGAVRISVNGSAYVNWSTPGGAAPGTVSSIGLSAPAALFSVTGSPVTTIGTLGLSLASQPANSVFAAPSGAAGAPAFRLLEVADIPALPFSKITGTLGQTQGGTGLTSYAFGDLIYADATATLARLPGNTTPARRFLTQTGNGTISGAPAWNLIASSDVPAINLSASGNGGVTGTLGATNGGTGLSAPCAGNLFVRSNGGGTAFECASLTAGAGISISHAAGATTITNTGGGSAAAGGADTQVQFNDAGALNGDAGLTFNKTTDVLTAAGGFNGNAVSATTAGALSANGSNCAAGLYAAGVDAGGNAEGCAAPTSGWEQLCSATLGSAAASISCGSFAARDTLQLIFQQGGLLSTTSTPLLRFNGDNGTNYSHSSTNLSALTNSGGTAQTQIKIDTADSTAQRSFTCHVSNKQTLIKLATCELITGTGSGSTPTRWTAAGVWNNTAAQITSVSLTVGGNFPAGAQLTVLGRNF